jgi:hypothetical protein
VGFVKGAMALDREDMVWYNILPWKAIPKFVE